MKKLLSVLLLGVLFLAACGQTESGTVSNEVLDNEVEEKAVKQEELKAPTVLEEKVNIYTSLGDPVYQYGSIIKNEGSETIRIYPYTLTIFKKDGSVADTFDTFVTPSYLEPGEEAYVTAHGAVDGLNQENYDKTQVNIDFEKTDFELLLLTAENVNYQKPEDEFSSPKVTGVLKNETGKTAKDIKVAATLLDADGNLLGVAHGYADNDLNDQGTQGFSITIYSSQEIVDLIERVEVKAQGFVD